MRAFPLILFIAIIAIISGGCSENDEIRAVLESAQACMETRPDSALAMLSVVDRSDADEDLKARHAVLLTEDQYMSRQCPPSDSLIASASQYYDRHMSDPQRMRAYYYRGRVLISLEEYGDAVISLLNAAHTAKLLDDHLWLGLIYRGIADSFDALMDNASALNYYDISYKEFAKAPENKYTDFAKLDLARAYSNLSKYDECRKISTEIYNQAKGNGNIYLEAGACQLLSKCAFELGNPKESYIYLEKKRELIPHSLSVKDWMHLGMAYLYAGDIEKSKEMNDSLQKIDPTEKWLTFEILNREGDSEAALPILLETIRWQNKYFSRLIERDFANVITNYYNLQMQQSDSEIKAIKQKHNIAICISLSIILCITIIFYYRSKLLKQKMSRYIDMAQSLKATLHEKSNTISQLESIQKDNQQQMVRLSASQNRAKYDARQSIQRILSSKFDILDQLCVTYYETQGKTYEKKRIYEKVIELIDGIRNDSDIARNLENTVNESMDRLIQRFRDDFPALKESDVQLFTLYVLGFSPRAISIMQGISINNVYTRKSNLKKSIEKSMVKNDEEYLSFLS